MGNFTCQFCSSGVHTYDKVCQRCGAPNFYYKPDGDKCVCGMYIDNEIRRYSAYGIICYKCSRTFSGSFNARYVEDKTYPTGQIVHVCEIAGLECPHCGEVFNRHEFYHGIIEDAQLLYEKYAQAMESLV